MLCDRVKGIANDGLTLFGNDETFRTIDIISLTLGNVRYIRSRQFLTKSMLGLDHSLVSSPRVLRVPVDFRSIVRFTEIDGVDG